MAWIDLKEEGLNNKQYLEHGVIIYRTIDTYTGRNKKLVTYAEILIPRSISTKAGIDIGGAINILYDPDVKKIKISPSKDNCSFVAKKRYADRNNHNPRYVSIRIFFRKSKLLPLSKKNITIKDWEIQSGIIFKLTL